MAAAVSITYDKNPPTYAPGDVITATVAVTGLAAAQPAVTTHYDGATTVILNDQTTLTDTDGIDVIQPPVPAQTVLSATFSLGGISMTETAPGSLVFKGTAKL